jgi:hypothetical protein
MPLPTATGTLNIDAHPQWGWGNVAFEDHYLLELRLEETLFTVDPHSPFILGREPGGKKEDIFSTQQIDPHTESLRVLDLTGAGAAMAGVSRKHARIACSQRLLTVTDLGSKNGTFINGKRLREGTPRILRDADKLQLGKLIFEVHFVKHSKHNDE